VYQVDKSNGQFKVVGRQYGTAPFGIALPKGSGLDKPLLAAVKALMANGYYKTSLKKWDISAGAITTPTINGATS
jgi:polar amino acid transport system substrate-binding protein